MHPGGVATALLMRGGSDYLGECRTSSGSLGPARVSPAALHYVPTSTTSHATSCTPPTSSTGFAVDKAAVAAPALHAYATVKAPVRGDMSGTSLTETTGRSARSLPPEKNRLSKQASGGTARDPPKPKPLSGGLAGALFGWVRRGFSQRPSSA